MKKVIQHGEVILYRIDKMPEGGTSHKETSLIIAHSESGHHHVLESETPFKVTMLDKDRLYLELFEPAKLVHKKSFDFHPTEELAPGVYKRFHKTEYSAFDKVIRDVKD